MENCAYCGENVGDDGVYVDDEIFCSEECMRDYGARASYDADDDEYEEDDDEYEEDDDDDSIDDEEDDEEDDDDDDDDDYDD